MKTVSKVTGFTLASTAAALLLAGCSTAGDGAGKSMHKNMSDVKCSGVNSCKGTSACKTATSACKGHNSCKGKGWIKTSAADCSAKGGTTVGQS